ncbi:hypothetical protein L21SP4_00980 [Kiritimatiella glycovorans]|uniref:DUF2752 domain-containing protein n=2 Tax=Kiritimatiella glycovorans TaxID=1307763 RepID=A0A0G3EHC6_9BACT|nr:hypothetical protein L21SP4_00980 [Kiritimatiella glycovorans]
MAARAAGVILGLAAAGLPLAARVWPGAPACRFHAATGLPCPACGTWRALAHLGRGQWAAAFALQPLASGCVLAAFAAAWVLLARPARPIPDGLRRTRPARLLILLLLLWIANWVYLLAHGV